MNIPQTSYAMYFTQAILGMQALASEVARKISRTAAGIIYYGRAVIQSRLYDSVCRLPRANKFTITVTGSTMSAGSMVSAITHGTIANGEVAASTSITTVTTAFTSNLANTMIQHAADIAAAMEDCFTCVRSSATIVYIGDCEDITAVTTSFTSPGSGDDAAATAAITTADVAADLLGLAYLTHNRQQQLTTGYTYFEDKEPVNICQGGTIWVYGEEAFGPADALYVRLITNSTKYAGYIGKSSDSSKCVALTGAKAGTTISAAGIVPVTVNWPQ
jgi:hypothetical protein